MTNIMIRIPKNTAGPLRGASDLRRDTCAVPGATCACPPPGQPHDRHTRLISHHHPTRTAIRTCTHATAHQDPQLGVHNKCYTKGCQGATHRMSACVPRLGRDRSHGEPRARNARNATFSTAAHLAACSQRISRRVFTAHAATRSSPASNTPRALGRRWQPRRRLPTTRRRLPTTRPSTH